MNNRLFIYVLILALVLLPAPPPAAAQSCATLAFNSYAYGFTGSRENGSGYPSGTGNYATAAYTSTYTITSVTAYFTVTTPGTDPGLTSSITHDAVTLVTGTARIVAGSFTMVWSDAGNPQSNGTLTISVAAPTGGAVLLTGAEICGDVLPDDWTTPSDSPFPEETPWARPTPTPWAINDDDNWAEPITFNNEDVGQFADTIINSYNFLNQSNVLDFAIAAIMMLMLIGLLTRAIRSGKELQ